MEKLISSTFILLGKFLTSSYPNSKTINEVKNKLLTTDNVDIEIEDSIIVNDLKSHLIISNHISCLDYCVINSLIKCKVITFLCDNSKNYDENIEKLGIISYDYMDKNSGKIVKEKIVELTSNSENILLFPEGRISLEMPPSKFYSGGIKTCFDNNIDVLTLKLSFINDEGIDETDKHNSYLDLMLHIGNFPIKKPKIKIKTLKIIRVNEYLNFDDFFNEIYNSYL